MTEILEPAKLKELELANRFVRSATWEGMADPDGGVTPRLIDTLTELARGGVGLIISSHAYVRPEGQAGPWQMGVDKDAHIQGLQRLTEAVHANGSKIVLQLAHAGTFGAAKLTGLTPWVASDFDGLANSPRHAMTADDLKSLIRSYAGAARRAKTAGFDGVQLHSAHGYLLSQFLSPHYNRRTDAYGGDIRNRVRLHLEILGAVREAVGEDYPLLIKMNGQDFIENGLVLGDAVEAARMLAAAGLDALELSGGTLTSGKLSPSRMAINKPEKEAYFREEARAFKAVLNIPLILVGGNRSYEVAAGLIREGLADFIAMSRPLICEPHLIKRWREGDRRPAQCKSDNLCFGPAMEGKGIACMTAAR